MTDATTLYRRWLSALSRGDEGMAREYADAIHAGVQLGAEPPWTPDGKARFTAWCERAEVTACARRQLENLR